MRHGSPSKRISPLVHRVDAGDALDQRRLAGAVVADERHHLAVAHLEVDVGQRLHGAERLGDSAELEKGVSLIGASHTTDERRRPRAPPRRRRRY
jgi:hypothetical protein